MKSKVKVVQFGCGRMGSVCMKYTLNIGAEIVGAFDLNPAVIGKDIGERVGCNPVGVINKDAKKL